ncbi:adenine-specific DNA-methyltransferase [Luteococcus japonicus]|uniref:Adenine-specific DNA-methyltransferase n=1 Tax=Luteococcus japonicus TaxID=33984 RepID=A0A3N1ZW90_9ACTN|nr:site-specific DNA-methyltransferase [Luteococcus japonicus]ROR55066.1 adenine-specific DNA-methyltransferase [Luteococcus japonicus]
MSRLTDLIQEAKRLNPELGEAIDKEVKHLQDRRAFGLNFERHAPEAVDLFGRPIRMGDKVRMLAPRGETAAPDTRLWKVTGATGAGDGRIVQLRDDATGDTAEHPLPELVVVAESNDVIYPGLESTRRIELDGNKPFHTVVNAENLHALKALLYTHRASIDCIYIDPPYNTGNDDWIYSDRYVGGEDLYRHSKWLSFMERRLVLAKELSKDTGVIIVAIGDDEHHRLRMLMDQTFGAENFISDVVWQGGRKNDSRYVSNGADYMLIFAKRSEALRESGIRWRETKQGLAEARKKAAELRSTHSPGPELAKAWKTWLKVAKAAGTLSDSVARFDVLSDDGEPINTYGNITWPGNGGHYYEVPHPITGEPVKKPLTGWRFNESKMHDQIAAGRVWFGSDASVIPRGITYLSEVESEVPLSVFQQDRKAANTRARKVLGDTRFPNPKDHNVLMRWISLVAGSHATVLDFFGGSGSTLEAVARLNAQDGGTRQCILVTNNEVGAKEAKRLVKEGHRQGDPEWEAVGVHDWVTKPRIVAVTTGERPDGSTFEDTVPANVEFFKLTYEAPLKVKSHHDFLRIAPLLWLRAGARGRRIEELPNGWDVADSYGVIDRLERVDQFVAALEANPEAKLAYVVTDDERRFQTVCADLPDHVEPVRLYESYLRNFEIDAARSAR